MVEGVRQGSLGGMWDPVYFNYGIAVHGALNVPLHPASHGCIRIPLSLSPTRSRNSSSVGDQVFVFDGVKEPEAYGAQKPYFNRIDPDYSTTTSSTTSTTTTTTTTGSALHHGAADHDASGHHDDRRHHDDDHHHHGRRPPRAPSP